VKHQSWLDNPSEKFFLAIRPQMKIDRRVKGQVGVRDWFESVGCMRNQVFQRDAVAKVPNEIPSPKRRRHECAVSQTNRDQAVWLEADPANGARLNRFSEGVEEDNHGGSDVQQLS
jgi:hypothetical protein